MKNHTDTASTFDETYDILSDMHFEQTVRDVKSIRAQYIKQYAEDDNDQAIAHLVMMSN